MAALQVMAGEESRVWLVVVAVVFFGWICVVWVWRRHGAAYVTATRRKVEDQLRKCKLALAWLPSLDALTLSLLATATHDCHDLRQKPSQWKGVDPGDGADDQFADCHARSRGGRRRQVVMSLKRFASSVGRLQERVIRTMESTPSAAIVPLEELRDLICILTSTPAPQCVAVHGSKGGGKSTLTSRLCASWIQNTQLMQKYPDGPHFVHVGSAGCDPPSNALHGQQDLLDALTWLYKELKASPERVQGSQHPPSALASDIPLPMKKDSQGALQDCSILKARFEGVCGRIRELLRRQKCLVILDGVSLEQARLVGKHMLSSGPLQAAVVVTSRHDVSGLLQAVRFELKPSVEVQERIFASYAYGNRHVLKLADRHKEDGIRILYSVENSSLLRLIGQELCAMGDASWGLVADAVLTMPKDLATAMDLHAYLAFHKADTIMHRDYAHLPHLKTLLAVFKLFRHRECLSEAVVYHVWYALCVHRGDPPSPPPGTGTFREHLKVLKRIALVERFVKVLGPCNTDGIVLHPTLRWHLDRERHNLQATWSQCVYPAVRDLQSSSPDDSSPTLVALCCIYLLGTTDAAQLASDALRNSHVGDLGGWKSPTLWHRCMYRQIFTASVPALLEGLQVPDADVAVQHLLISAVTECIPGVVKSRVQQLLGHIQTAPVALAIVIGSDHEDMLPLSEGLKELVASVEAEPAFMSASATADVMEQVWKALVLVLGAPELALPVIEAVVHVRKKVLGPEHILTRSAALYKACTLDACGQQVLADRVLLSAGACNRTRQPWSAQEYALEAHRLYGLALYEQAAVYGEVSLAVHSELKGDTHPATISCLRMLAWTMYRLGRHNDALRHFVELAARRMDTLGANHYLTRLSQAEVGVAYAGIGSLCDALQLKQRRLDDLQKQLGTRHPVCVRLRRSVAISLASLGHYAAAATTDEALLADCKGKGALGAQIEAMYDVAADYQLAAPVSQRHSSWVCHQAPHQHQEILERAEQQLLAAQELASQLWHSCGPIHKQMEVVQGFTRRVASEGDAGSGPLVDQASSSDDGTNHNHNHNHNHKYESADAGGDSCRRKLPPVSGYIASLPDVPKPEVPLQPLMYTMDSPNDQVQVAIGDHRLLEGTTGTGERPSAPHAWDRSGAVSDMTHNVMCGAAAGGTLAVHLLAHSAGWRALLENATAVTPWRNPGLATSTSSQQVPASTNDVQFVADVLVYWRQCAASWEAGPKEQREMARMVCSTCAVLEQFQERGSQSMELERILVVEAQDIVESAAVLFDRRTRSAFSETIFNLIQYQVAVSHGLNRFRLRSQLLKALMTTAQVQQELQYVSTTTQEPVSRVIRSSQALLATVLDTSNTVYRVAPLLQKVDSDMFEMQVLESDAMREAFRMELVRATASEPLMDALLSNFQWSDAVEQIGLSTDSDSGDKGDQLVGLETAVSAVEDAGDCVQGDMVSVHDGNAASSVLRCPVKRVGYTLLGERSAVRFHRCCHVVSRGSAEGALACPVCNTAAAKHPVAPDARTLRLLQFLLEVKEISSVDRSRTILSTDDNGSVFLGQYEGQDVAVKVLNVNYFSSESLYSAVQEVAVTKAISRASCSFQQLVAVAWTARGAELVMQFCATTLRGVMEDTGGHLPVTDVSLLLLELLTAMLALHNGDPRLDCDITVDNVLVDKKRVCVAVRGASARAQCSLPEQVASEQPAGTPLGAQCVYGVGAVAVYAASGFSLRRAGSTMNHSTSHGTGIPVHLPNDLQGLLQKMTLSDMNLRPSLIQAQEEALLVFSRLAATEPPVCLQPVYWSRVPATVVLNGHTDLLQSVAWDPAGGRLATASWDGTAAMWDTASGAQLRVLEGHNGAVWSVAWDPAGGRLATSSRDHTAAVWDAVSGACLRVLEGHKGYVRSVGWDPEGGRLATASDDCTAAVWDAASGVQLQVLKGHKATVQSVAWDPAGGRLATASDDCTVVVWDTASGAQLRVLEGHKATVRSVAWDPAGARVASASSDRTAAVWDAASGAQLQVLEGHNGYVGSVAWDPAGGRLATASWDRTAAVWDTASWARLQVLVGHRNTAICVAWDPAGGRLATASWDCTAAVWVVGP